MSKLITVAVDAMGGDHSPEKVIKGINYFIYVNYRLKWE